MYATGPIRRKEDVVTEHNQAAVTPEVPEQAERLHRAFLWDPAEPSP